MSESVHELSLQGFARRFVRREDALNCLPMNTLPLVTLGRSDLRVTPICLGTMTFGEQVGEATAHELLDHALARGLNFVDTAEMYAVPARRETYGATERIIGNWLAARPGVRN